MKSFSNKFRVSYLIYLYSKKVNFIKCMKNVVWLQAFDELNCMV